MHEVIKVLCHVDWEHGFKTKPKGKAIGGIQERFKTAHFDELPLEKVVQALETGHTIALADCIDRKKEGFKRANALPLDFDNGHCSAFDKAMNVGNYATAAEIVRKAIAGGEIITPDEVRERCRQYGFAEPLIYNTFSHGKYLSDIAELEAGGHINEVESARASAAGTFRAIWIFSETVTDLTLYEDLCGRFRAVFPESDPAFNIAGLAFGTRYEIPPQNVTYTDISAVPPLFPAADEVQEVQQAEFDEPFTFSGVGSTSSKSQSGYTADKQRENIRSYLKYIPPSQLTGGEWLNIGNAMKTEGFSYNEFDEWSRSDGDSRYDERENRRRWDSLEIGKCTGGTICDIAKRFGWTSTKGAKGGNARSGNAGSNTVSTGYAYGLQFKHGIDISANAEDSKGKPQIVLTPFVFEKLCAALEINFRWDDLRHKVVYSGFSKNELQDTLTNTAPTILKEAFTGLKLKQNNTENISECIRVHASRRHFNPVLEMISGVQWDGIDRVQQIYDMWELTDPYSKTFMLKWLYQCYCMLYNGTEGESWSGEFVLVLKGAQGAGKTQFFKHLAITDSFFNEGTTFDPKDKDSQLEVFSSWICELGELGSTMKKDMDMVKAAITRAKDSIRPPYARSAEEYPRRTTFCATVNDDKFLIDMTGNRRWAVIGFDDDFKIPFSKIKALDSLQLWAQIRADVETEIMTTAGTADPKTHENIFRFTEEELKEVFRRTRGYLKPPKGFEEVSDIITAFEQRDPYKGFVLKHKRMSITDWQTETKNVSTCLQKYSSREIGVCLKVLGYERGSDRVNGQTVTGFYLPYWERTDTIY